MLEAMRQRQLGSDGLVTSALGMGCMGLSQGYGPADDDESIRAIRRAAELGVTMFDTAMSYGQGHNERLIGRALAGLPWQVQVATKFGIVRDPAGVHLDGRPEPAVPHNVPQRACRAGPGIRRTIDQSADPGVQHGAGAHSARLERDDERAAVEAPGPCRFGRLPDGHDLGVRGRVGGRDAPVMPASGDGSVRPEYDRADRDVGIGRRAAVGSGGLFHRQPHAGLERGSITGRSPGISHGTDPSFH